MLIEEKEHNNTLKTVIANNNFTHTRTTQISDKDGQTKRRAGERHRTQIECVIRLRLFR